MQRYEKRRKNIRRAIIVGVIAVVVIVSGALLFSGGKSNTPTTTTTIASAGGTTTTCTNDHDDLAHVDVDVIDYRQQLPAGQGSLARRCFRHRAHRCRSHRRTADGPRSQQLDQRFRSAGRTRFGPHRPVRPGDVFHAQSRSVVVDIQSLWSVLAQYHGNLHALWGNPWLGRWARWHARRRASRTRHPAIARLR